MNLVFDADNRKKFSQHYPEQPHKLKHMLAENKLLTLDALAELGEALPKDCVEYNKGDLPVGIAPEDVESTGLSIGETIRNVEQSGSWAVLKNIEQNTEYNAILLDLLDELKPHIQEKTGKMLRPQGFIFVSSPNAVTPYHFDPEHNILMQLRGTKTMTQFQAGNAQFAPDETHETYHTGGPRNLVWQDEFSEAGSEWHLSPGDALFVPVMAPHFVKNGPEPSISLSITWRSEWSFAEADARAFNHMLRKVGIRPSAPGRFPASNRGKAYLLRAFRKVGLAA